MTLTVRRILPEDADILRDLRLAALSDEPDAFGSDYEFEMAFADEVWRSRALDSSAGDRAATFIARDGDAPVGLVTGLRTNDVVDLVSMWTGRAFRRQGLGRRLVDAVVEWAASVGARRVELWVMSGNDAAQRLYEATGFHVTEEYQPLASDPCKDEVRMVREIARDGAT